MTDPDVVDRIYEAAALPEQWAELFHDISVSNGFVGGGMFTVNNRFSRVVASRDVVHVMTEFIEKGWSAPERNPRAPRTAKLNYAGFVADHDILTDEQIETEPMYVELLRPHGLGWGAGSVINTPSGDTVVLTFEGAYAKGPTSRETLLALDGLRPHLARAALFAGRLDMERSRAQVSALSGLGLPAAVLTADNRALAANAEFEGLTAQFTIGANDKVSVRDAKAARLLAEMLDQPASVGAGRSIPIRAARGAPPTVLHVLPVRRAARDVFSRAAWLLVATPLGQAVAPDAILLTGLFDLSPAEARVARALIEGKTVAEVAKSFNLAEATVRNQLRMVFIKTGASRQAELVALCGGIGLPSL